MKTQEKENMNNSFYKHLNEINDIFKNKKELTDYNFEQEENKQLDENLSNFNEETEEKEIENILVDLNKAVQIDINEINIKRNKNKYFDECQEILSILRKPLRKKYITDKGITPFKIFNKPRKINMKGKVLSDIPSNDSTQNNSCNRNNIYNNNFSANP